MGLVKTAWGLTGCNENNFIVSREDHKDCASLAVSTRTELPLVVRDAIDVLPTHVLVESDSEPWPRLSSLGKTT